jgi:excisionase family DNA binding protein
MIYLDGARKYDDVMTIEDVMDYLAVGKCTAYKLLKQKKIKSFRIGKVYKIPKESLLEYVRNERK